MAHSWDESRDCSTETSHRPRSNPSWRSLHRFLNAAHNLAAQFTVRAFRNFRRHFERVQVSSSTRKVDLSYNRNLYSGRAYRTSEWPTEETITQYGSFLVAPQRINNRFHSEATVGAQCTVTSLDHRMYHNGGEISLWTQSQRDGQSSPRRPATNARFDSWIESPPGHWPHRNVGVA